MSYNQETARLARSVGFEDKDLRDFGRLLEGLIIASKTEEREACAQFQEQRSASRYGYDKHGDGDAIRNHG